jgi:hypothetical protein
MVLDLRVIADGIFFFRTSKLIFETVIEEDGLRNKLEMGLRSYIYRKLGSNGEHLHRHDLFSNAYSAQGVLNQHPAIGYSHPLN